MWFQTSELLNRKVAEIINSLNSEQKDPPEFNQKQRRKRPPIGHAFFIFFFPVFLVLRYSTKA